MCKIKFVEVSQIMDKGKAVGMQYKDNWMGVWEFSSKDEAFSLFKETVDSVITDNQSILLCREDVKRFASSIANKINGDSTCVFKMFKDYLRQNYIVKKIIMNPRTLEYYPHNKVFIIHKL
jgi:hypothetical protein